MENETLRIKKVEEENIEVKEGEIFEVAKAQKKLVEELKEEIENFENKKKLKNNKILVNGAFGTGKTYALKEILFKDYKYKSIKGYEYKVVYFNCSDENLEKDMDSFFFFQYIKQAKKEKLLYRMILLPIVWGVYRLVKSAVNFLINKAYISFAPFVNIISPHNSVYLYNTLILSLMSFKLIVGIQIVLIWIIIDKIFDWKVYIYFIMSKFKWLTISMFSDKIIDEMDKREDIIYVFEDIDRLEKKEIMSVFKFINKFEKAPIIITLDMKNIKKLEKGTEDCNNVYEYFRKLECKIIYYKPTLSNLMVINRMNAEEELFYQLLEYIQNDPELLITQPIRFIKYLQDKGVIEKDKSSFFNKNYNSSIGEYNEFYSKYNDFWYKYIEYNFFIYEEQKEKLIEIYNKINSEYEKIDFLKNKKPLIEYIKKLGNEYIYSNDEKNIHRLPLILNLSKEEELSNLSDNDVNNFEITVGENIIEKYNKCICMKKYLKKLKNNKNAEKYFNENKERISQEYFSNIYYLINNIEYKKLKMEITNEEIRIISGKILEENFSDFKKSLKKLKYLRKEKFILEDYIFFKNDPMYEVLIQLNEHILYELSNKNELKIYKIFDKKLIRDEQKKINFENIKLIESINIVSYDNGEINIDEENGDGINNIIEFLNNKNEISKFLEAYFTDLYHIDLTSIKDIEIIRLLDELKIEEKTYEHNSFPGEIRKSNIIETI